MSLRAAAVGAVGHRAAQAAAREPDRLLAPDVGDGIGALVGRPPVRRGGARARVVGDRGVRLDRMAEHVEADRGGDGARRRQRQVRVDDAEQRAQVGVRDARLDVVLGQVDDRDRRRLGAGAAGRRDAEQRQQRPGNGRALADRRVEVVVDAAGVRREQRGDLRGVDGRPAAEPDEAVEAALARGLDRELRSTTRSARCRSRRRPRPRRRRRGSPPRRGRSGRSPRAGDR